jgi:2-polyprenyl-3-methyl-5-hydroxy-6-metoxy-1,4-benzoquinol methylase
MAEYRKRIYVSYASHFQNSAGVFCDKSLRQWGRAYDYFFRGWMPRDKEMSIVDVACGGGKLLYFFKQRGYTDVRGVDISPEQVTIARHMCPHVHEGNVLDFLQSHLDMFDLITGLDIIEHLHKSEVLTFLDNCMAALKSGGRLILQTPNADSPWFASLRYGDFTHEVCFTPAALSRLLALCGYKNIVVREQGPVASGYSIVSTVRYLIWQAIRQLIKIWNLVETGNAGSGVFTRVFIIAATKR